MTKTRLLSIAVVVLLASNIGMMVFFMMGPPHKGRQHQRPKVHIIEKLELDAAQQAAYEELITDHRTKIKQHNQEMQVLRKQLYQVLNDEQQAAKADLTRQIGDLQQAIESTHFQHFSDLRALLSPEQLPNFKELTLELANLFQHRKKRK